MTEAATRICRFPGCTRPAGEGDGRGRPPAYCDDPGHTRAAAYRARRDAEAEGGVTGAATVEEPVTFARVRAGLLVERVEAAVAALSTMTAEVVAELRTLGDVEAVEVELESVSASAEQRAAEARAVAAEAEARRRRAEAAAVEAEQLRAEAEAAAEESLLAEARSREVALSAQEEAERLSAEVGGLYDERDAALTKVREVTEALATAHAEIEQLTADLDQVRAALLEQTEAGSSLGEQVEAERARAERAEGAIARRDERIRGLEENHAAASAEVAGLTAQLRAERAAAATAAAVAERTATERVAEVRAVYEERIAELRQRQNEKP